MRAILSRFIQSRRRAYREVMDIASNDYAMDMHREQYALMYRAVGLIETLAWVMGAAFWLFALVLLTH